MEETTDISILKLLLQATKRRMMTWSIVGDDNRELFASQLGADSFEIELVYLQRATQETCERCLVRIQGPRIYETYSIGTVGYALLLQILREDTFGWKDAAANVDITLIKLKKRLEDAVAEQSTAPLPAAPRPGPSEGAR